MIMTFGKSQTDDDLRIMMTYVLYNMYEYDAINIYIYVICVRVCVCCRYLPLIAASPTTLR